MNWVRALAGVLVLWSSTAWGATLTWNANTESDVAGYRVYHCTHLPCTQTSGTATILNNLGKVTSVNIGTPAVTQYYFVTAYDFANHESGGSNVATYTPGAPSASAPPPPHLVWGASTAGSATLAWNANTDTDLWGYRIYQCTQQPCTPTSGHASLLVRLGKTTSYNIGTPAVTHYYFVRAYDLASHESGSSNVATFTPGAPPSSSLPPAPPPPSSLPPPPPNLVWGASTAGSATLKWNVNTDTDLAGYHVYHCTHLPCTRTSGTASLFTTLGKVTSFHIGAPAVTQYYFITAYDFANHESGSSNVVTFTPGAPSTSTPLPPHLVWGASTAGSATLAWNANTDTDLAGYHVYHCTHLPCTRTSGTASLFNTLGKVTSFHIGAAAITQYYFITAYDLANHESAGSNVVTFTPGG